MSTTEEATINPDGTAEFPSDSQQPPVSPPDESASAPPTSDPTDTQTSPLGIDPAVYLIAAVLIAGFLFYFLVHRKKSQQKEDSFFLELDGDKVFTFYFALHRSGILI
jgi:hypothetical protein